MAGTRSALIVANDRYDNEGLRHLRSPAADADALGRVLGDPAIGGFRVEVVRNEPAHVISSRIEDFFSDSRPDDVLLLHFSCHGLKSESGELFFAATGTRPDRLGSTAISADFVQRCIRSSRSRSIVLLLDCCYGGAFSQGVRVRAAGDVDVLDSFRGGGRGRAVITASSAMEYAFEGDQLADASDPAPSVFTAALVQGLRTGEADRDEDGWVSLDELYDYVFDTVRERNAGQTPSRDVEMQGDLYIARSGRRRVKPQPVPAPLRAAMGDANMYTRIGAVAELRTLLHDEDAAVAAGAREALQEIAATDIRYVAGAAAQTLAEAPEPQPEAEAEPAVPQPAPERRPPRVRREYPWMWVVLTAAGVASIVLGLAGLAIDVDERRVASVEIQLGVYAAVWLLVAIERTRLYRILPAVISAAAVFTLVWLLIVKPSYLEYYSIDHTPLYPFWLVAGLLELAATIGRRAPTVDLERVAGALAVIFGCIVFYVAGQPSDSSYAVSYGFFVLAYGAVWVMAGLRRRPPS